MPTCKEKRFLHPLVAVEKLLIALILSVSLQADDIPTDDASAISATCGLFEDMFQTHHECALLVGGTINFNNAGSSLDGSKNVILSNSDNTLNTCQVTAKQWVNDDYKTCGEKGDCEATGTSGKTLDITYNNPPLTATISSSPSSSTNDITLSANSTKTESSYDEITTASYKSINTTFNITDSLKINSLKTTIDNTFIFQSANPYSIDIGTLEMVKKNGTGNTITTDTNAENIKIGTFDLTSATTLDLSASQTIKMNDFTAGRGSSDITLKAPYININTMTLSNSGSGKAAIHIIADYIDIGTLNFGQGATLTIEPFTPDKRVLFRSNSITATSSSTMIIPSGNYYTDTLDIPGTSDASSIIASDENQLINLFINGDFEPGNNPGINSAGNGGKFGTNPAANFMMFIDGDLETGGGGTTFNATIYVEGNAKFGNPTYIRGALSANTFIEIGQGQFTYYQSIGEAGWAGCSDNPPSLAGAFDAWDTFRTTPDRNISTKISGKEFYLKTKDINSTELDGTLAALDALDTALSLALSDIKIRYRLYDMDNNKNISNWQNYPSNNTIIPFTVTTAHKKIRVQFRSCITSLGTAAQQLANPGLYCSDILAPSLLASTLLSPSSSGYDYISYSTDAFAIRPEKFMLSPNASEDIELLTSAKDYNLSLLATKHNTTDATTDYNVTHANNVFDTNETLYLQNGTIDNTLDGTISFTSSDFNISDGSASNVAGIKFTDVGKVNIQIQDRDWSKVDLDDTPQNCDDNGSYICGDINATFIPARFLITNAHLHNDKNSSFTYLSDDLNMSAHVGLTISALNDEGDVTKNFSNGKWENPVDVNLTVPTKIGLVKNDINNSINLGFADGSLAIPWDETNTSKNLFFNFGRVQNTAQNPFDINGSDVNITVISTYTNTTTGVTKDVNETGNPDKNVTFYYGRVHAPDQKFRDKNGTAKIYYEVYCDGCNKTDFNITGDESIDSINWFTNTLHVSSTSGSVSSYTPSGTVSIDNTPTISLGKEELKLSVNKTPHKDKIDMTSSSWLVYSPSNPNATTTSFLVEFYSGASWAGQGEQGKTIDLNISKIQNKRLDW